MGKEDKIIEHGTVTKALPNGRFKVELPNEHVVLGHVSGSIRKNNIRIMENDRVKIALSPYDLSKGIIKYRYSDKEWNERDDQENNEKGKN